MRRSGDGVCEREAELNFSLCDFTGRCKPSTLLRIGADLAGEDYRLRGLPHDRLWAEGFMFLVSRARFHLRRNIRAEERVRLGTYERCVSGPFCMRDYTIDDASGERIVSGRSAWILCNPQTRRIVRPKSFPHPLETHTDLPLDCGDPERLRLPEGMAPAGERPVVYSDLDGNGHVNNAVYADMACDVLPAALFEGELRDFSINFVQEARLGDRIALFSAEAEGTSFVAGYVEDALCFECALTFQ